MNERRVRYEGISLAGGRQLQLWCTPCARSLLKRMQVWQGRLNLVHICAQQFTHQIPFIGRQRGKCAILALTARVVFAPRLRGCGQPLPRGRAKAQVGRGIERRQCRGRRHPACVAAILGFAAIDTRAGVGSRAAVPVPRREEADESGQRVREEVVPGPPAFLRTTFAFDAEIDGADVGEWRLSRKLDGGGRLVLVPGGDGAVISGRHGHRLQTMERRRRPRTRREQMGWRARPLESNSLQKALAFSRQS